MCTKRSQEENSQICDLLIENAKARLAIEKDKKLREGLRRSIRELHILKEQGFEWPYYETAGTEQEPIPA